MKIKRSPIAAAQRFTKWFLSRFKPLSVHTEAIMIDDIWEEIQKQVEAKSVHTWHVMTPANMDYFRYNFNVQMNKKEASKIMKERYLEMMKKGERIELHIHLSQIMKNMTYKDQEERFKESIEWMQKELGITPTEFVPGWWSYNEDTVKICKKYKLKMIHEHDMDYSHDYFAILPKVNTKPIEEKQ